MTAAKKFREAFNALILPQLKTFAPELIVVSAGFDAHWRDPLANIQLQEKRLHWVTRRLMDLASGNRRGRIVSVLEEGMTFRVWKDSVNTCTSPR